MDKQDGRRVKKGLKNALKAKIQFDSLRAIEKYQIRKRLIMMAYIDTGFKKFTYIPDKQTIEMN